MKNFENLAGSSRKYKRTSNDFYITPDFVTRALLKKESIYGIVWEPACGDGAISKILNKKPLIKKVISTDIIYRGYGKGDIDFLEYSLSPKCDCIITNPPYTLAQQFIENALECSKHKVVMLLKLAFLEGQKRQEFFRRTPLSKVYVFSRRIDFGGNNPNKGAGILAYAWFVWDKKHVGNPQIDWI